ncbi:tryptophan synthase beta subunit-like PLP-dependent enzyme [Polychaeton citri CBS 116435]|uniref:Tryptophan synthase beta subunit-like PLP-dependent enzyme n=1 Tax=Polychaeton citri CBS 116435 TaxID=1314669 RepID=A0A9P4UM94_9PEZI|nr:tryptophan synthase beta subunit-like PLP-dependent enzyme [Polychaeton citri CBS 116435]
MATYQVEHLSTDARFSRPYTLFNPHFEPSTVVSNIPIPSAPAEAFHKQLPHYGETQLHSLNSLAQTLGFAHVFLKDESTRFGLPSFKILGASWAIYRALCKHLKLPQDPSSTTFDDLRSAIIAANQDSSSPVRLVTCSEGNWGRACARMASYLSLPCDLYVPAYMSEFTKDLIRNEGANIHVVNTGPGGGTYDDAIAAVEAASEEAGAILVLDTSWEGFEEIPGWVTEGYGTMLAETDRQVGVAVGNEKAKSADVVFCSVGVGSWAHAVAEHYHPLSQSTRQQDNLQGGPQGAKTKFFTVEPDTAASLKESLHIGRLTSIETGNTIMCGMNCGTPSAIAWKVLRQSVFAAIAVTDQESHAEVEGLRATGVNAGPCGAANVAALKRAVEDGMLGSREERAGKVAVLFSTEGWREYALPQ